jgi:hypothetical protein
VVSSIGILRQRRKPIFAEDSSVPLAWGVKSIELLAMYDEPVVRMRCPSP